MKVAETEAKTEMEAETEAETEAAETTDMSTTEISHCQKVVALVQAVLQEWRLAEEVTWQAGVLVPKEGG